MTTSARTDTRHWRGAPGRARAALHARQRFLFAALAIGALGFTVVPWHVAPGSTAALSWLADPTAREHAPALLQLALYGQAWFVWGALLLAACALASRPGGARLGPDPGVGAHANALVAGGALGLVWLFAQGYGMEAPPGLGLGACLAGTSFAAFLAAGLAARGSFHGDPFLATSLVTVTGLVALFTLFPLAVVSMTALADHDGLFAPSAFLERLGTGRVWGLGCLGGGARCGVAWNTLALALLAATGCTVLALAFSLVVARTALPGRRTLRALATLPLVAPPFVIGLALILVFGRSGLVNQFLAWAFDVAPARWIYGMQGILVAQIFAFTPIAFLVLVGVVDTMAPTLEEASQTLRADRWRTFRDVSLPLMMPGLANAFLVSFIESIADFGNPILLGGDFGVLATEIYFSVVGAQLDAGRAAALGVVLLGFALVAFVVQRVAVGGKVYSTLTGRSDAGRPVPLPAGVRRTCHALVWPWAIVTVLLYAMVLGGGFAETWGHDYTPTLRHYARAFGIEWGPHGILWAGAAWSSLATTVSLSALGAPLTALLGIVTAYLLTRQRFVGRAAFEFATLLSFAIPGTVVGVAYILAFNTPPLELTGTALILVACNVFRSMPVSVRAGMAAMSQIDRGLDEASATLGARPATTLRRVLLPLLRPAIVASLVYGFVRSMTTLSAVIFLVSAEHPWATTYIIDRVANGDYGVAIAYSSVLIVLTAAVIATIRAGIGQSRLAALRRPIR